MKMNVQFFYKQEYLPTKRHRKLRSRYVCEEIDVDVKELTAETFPVAFLIHDCESVCEGMKSYSDYDNVKSDYRMFTEEIRTVNGKLYKPVRITHGAAISTLFEDLEEVIKNAVRRRFHRYPSEMGGYDFSADTVVKTDDREDCISEINGILESYVIYDGKAWEECREPMYVINTFGLGHNHGGTGFFIEYFYNDNISKKNYFNALQRDEAIAYGKAVALGRGDDKSVDGMGDYDIIEVLMPEMVKRNPEKEHGDGDEFLNSIESVIKESSSAAEAGILALALTIAE